MKLKEIIEIALTYLGDDEPYVSEQTSKHPKIQLLIKCANLVIKEIACDYIPLIQEEIIQIKDGKFDYDSFPMRVREVLKVTDLDSGVRVKFRQNPNYCNVEMSKNALVKYSYIPDDIGVDDECVLSPKISAKTLALGVAAEYSLIEGLYEQSVMFGEKFREDIKGACRRNCELRMRPRVWK